MKNKLFKAGLFVLCITMMSSCVPKKKILYLQDIDTSLTTNELNYKSLIKKDDILRIMVTSENMELVQPFNQFISATNQSSLNGAGQQAVVDVRIVNFKVTVLGEVNRPGTFNLDYNRITLLQVIGQAGDLTIYGNRKNITVLRDVDGVQTSHRVDLTNSDFIDSEFYYLQQNDVVVVEPNYAQVQAAGFNRNASLFVSIASVLISLIVIISRN